MVLGRHQKSATRKIRKQIKNCTFGGRALHLRQNASLAKDRQTERFEIHLMSSFEESISKKRLIEFHNHFYQNHLQQIASQYFGVGRHEPPNQEHPARAKRKRRALALRKGAKNLHQSRSPQHQGSFRSLDSRLLH